MAGLGFNAYTDMAYADSDGLKGFALNHRVQHDANAEAIVAQLNVTVPTFDVADQRAHQAWELLMLMQDEAPREARELVNGWLLLHAQIHQAEFDAVGFGTSPDLSTVDFRDPKQFTAWMFEHQQVHAQVAGALGVTL